MPDSDERFRELVARIGAFHITDRAMKAAQRAAETAVRNGRIEESVQRAYVKAARHYFSGFEREARGHLRDVDRRLEHVNQVRFNLSAERGVAVKRIEATQSVLRELAEIGEEP
jgi:imidazolonepropionase-like amidohydrolase